MGSTPERAAWDHVVAALSRAVAQLLEAEQLLVRMGRTTPNLTRIRAEVEAFAHQGAGGPPNAAPDPARRRENPADGHGGRPRASRARAPPAWTAGDSPRARRPPRRVHQTVQRRIRDRERGGGPESSTDQASSTRSTRPIGDPFPELEPLLWPDRAALVRLLVDAVIARRHIAGQGRRPMFAAYGPAHSGKTVVAEIVAHVLDLQRAPIVKLDRIRAGELTGRTRPRRGGFEFHPAKYLELPFACLDELGRNREGLGLLMRWSRTLAAEARESAMQPS